MTDTPERNEEPQPKSFDLGELSQAQLVRIGETILDHYKHQHAPGSYERAAYEGSLGLLGTFPHQPWWKRVWGWMHKRRAEKAMRTLRLVEKEKE